ncbi:MAG: hypothetical protein ABI721_02650 [Candidatus Dojkabacteria bacterium]
MENVLLNSLIWNTVKNLETENPTLYAKFIDCIRSGDTRILTTDDIADLLKRQLVTPGIQVRAVIHTTIYEITRKSLEEGNDVFFGENGFLNSAKKEMPELVEILVQVLNSDEPLSDHPELLPLEKFHLIFQRASDGLIEVNIMARTHLAYSTLTNILDRKPEDF